MIPNAIKIYKIYQNELLRLNCVDFGDLILHMFEIFSMIKMKVYDLNIKIYLNIS